VQCVCARERVCVCVCVFRNRFYWWPSMARQRAVRIVFIIAVRAYVLPKVMVRLPLPATPFQVDADAADLRMPPPLPTLVTLDGRPGT